MSSWLSLTGLLLALAGLGVLAWSRRRRVVARATLVPGATATLRVRGGARRGPHQIELSLRLAPVEGHRLYARLAAEGADVPPVVQVTDRPDLPLAPPEIDPGPPGELRLVLTRLERPLASGAELRIDLAPVPPTRLDGGVVELVDVG